MLTPFTSLLAQVLLVLLLVYSIGLVAGIRPQMDNYELVYPLLYSTGSPPR